MQGGLKDKNEWTTRDQEATDQCEEEEDEGEEVDEDGEEQTWLDVDGR